MTRSSIACLLALLASTSSSAQPGPAQVRPLTDAVTVAIGETEEHNLVAPDIAVLDEKEFLVTWDLSYERYQGSQLIDWGSAISGRKVSLQGQPVGEELVLEPFEQKSRQGLHRMAADASGRFAVLWEEFDSLDFLLRRFTPAGTPLGTTALEPLPVSGLFPRLAHLAMDASGRTAVVWPRTQIAGPGDLWMQLFDAAADPVARPFQIPFPGELSIDRPVVAMSQGISLVVYSITQPGGAYFALQRVDAGGRLRGSSIPVVGVNSRQIQAAIAANAAGRFVVAWVDSGGIGARLFDATGKKLGPVIRVTSHPRSRVPEVALDAHGNFVVVWNHFPRRNFDTPFEIRARLFNRDGVPQGGEAVVVSEEEELNRSDLAPAVAMTGAGTFLVGWSANLRNVDPEEFFNPGIQTRLYALLPDDDRCVWRDGTFLCDTARDGNLTHHEHPFGQTGDRPLLADFDGDGIDDPCVRRGTAFRCARPGRPDLVLRFGRSAHTPLAGDLDGDGDDDPCVRRGRAFLCDTAHDGGAPEVTIPLGSGSDEPVLGDVDGDGDDDPCIWSALVEGFLCDVTHSGTPILVYPADAQPGDRPLLGDLDGDGRADFCFARDETLLCDLDRDGVLTEEVLATEPGDVVVLGNVDGV